MIINTAPLEADPRTLVFVLLPDAWKPSMGSYDKYEDWNDPPDLAGERLADAWRRLKEVSSEEAEPRRHLLRELMKHPQRPGFNRLFNQGSDGIDQRIDGLYQKSRFYLIKCHFEPDGRSSRKGVDLLCSSCKRKGHEW